MPADLRKRGSGIPASPIPNRRVSGISALIRHSSRSAAGYFGVALRDGATADDRLHLFHIMREYP